MNEYVSLCSPHLQECIEIASGAQVLETHHACGRLGVVVQRRRGRAEHLLHQKLEPHAHHSLSCLLGCHCQRLEETQEVHEREGVERAMVVAACIQGLRKEMRNRRSCDSHTKYEMHVTLNETRLQKVYYVLPSMITLSLSSSSRY